MPQFLRSFFDSKSVTLKPVLMFHTDCVSPSSQCKAGQGE